MNAILNELRGRAEADFTDYANQILEAAAYVVQRCPEDIRPHEAMRVAIAGVEAAALAYDASATKDCVKMWEDSEFADIGESFDGFLHGMPVELIARLMLHIPVMKMDDPDGELNKMFALTVAETLGPDWAQAWYKFIVLVTKIA